jgi:ATP-binding protein involved in chromosome partitioning
MECTHFDGFSVVAQDHASHPRNYGSPESFDGHARITGPCGDTMEFWLTARDGKVERVSFITDGCGTSLACGSMAASLVEGRGIEEAGALGQKDILDALGGFPPESEHCALLAANTLNAACADYLSHQNKSRDGSHTERGSCTTCGDKDCSATRRNSNESEKEFAERQKLQSRLCRIRHKVIVLSGKGGVGKSTVAVNLATALMLSGKRVGLLDVDIHGPSIPTMLGLERETLQTSEEGLLPIDVGAMKVMSLGFLLQNQDDAVIWRGPMKANVIKQFLTDVVWGDLDYLIIDSPPGTGDEPLSVCQLIGAVDGAVVVTTPQKVAAVDVRKSITFCRQLQVPVLGVVENMSGFACPKCGEITQILRSGGGKRMADDMGVPFLGSIPIDPEIAEACDSGRAFVRHYAGSATAEIMRSLARPIAALDEHKGTQAVAERANGGGDRMKIAIPLADGKLAAHFGHCEHFALLDVDPIEKKILKREEIDAPPHEPGLLPPWLAERGVTTIITGGMGQRARDMFAARGIQVVVGASTDAPERLASDYLAGTLQVGENVCDH